MHILLRLQFLILLFVISISSITHATQIPLSLSIKQGVFIQELWQGSSLILCIANTNDSSKIIQVSEWKTELPNSILQRWHIPKNSSSCIRETSHLLGKGILEFTINGGERLGKLKLVNRMNSSQKRKKQTSIEKGINSLCSMKNVVVNTPILWLRSDASHNLDLVINDSRTLFEFPTKTDIILQQINIESISSNTLKVDEVNNIFTIQSLSQSTNQHIASVHFRTPKIKIPTMVILSGRKKIEQRGWQCFVTGMMVRP